MNTRFVSSLKHLFADRAILGFAFAILLLSAAYIIYVIVALQPNASWLPTHYSAFGETHFYRDKWYYFISFAVFGLLFMVVHIGLLVKLAAQALRPLALAFGWLSLLTITLIFVYTYSVLHIVS
jgi:hypothetical protein